MFSEINLRNHSSLHKLFYGLGIEYFSKCHKHFIWSFYEKIIQVCLNYLENDDEFKEDLIKDLKKK